VLPPGEHLATVLVSDTYGAHTEARVRVLMDELPLSEAVVGATLRRVRDALSASQGGFANQLVSALAAQSTSTSDARRFRRSLAEETLPTDESLTAELLDLIASASAASLGSPTARLQASGAIRTVLNAVDADLLDGLSQARGLSQVASLVAEALGSGVDATTAFNVVESMSSVLGATQAFASAENELIVKQAAVQAAHGLASALLSGSVRGELPVEALSAQVNVSAARSDASGLAGASVRGPGSAGAVRTQAALADVLGGGGVDGELDLVLYAMRRNVYTDPLEQTGGADSGSGSPLALGKQQAQLLSVTISDAASGAELDVRELSEPIVIGVKPLNERALVYGAAGDCSEFGFCNERGTCEGGACVCDSPFRSADCSKTWRCVFWNETRAEWATDGCTTILPPNNTDSDLLYCSCNHLTTFSGVSVPTSLEELEQDVASFNVNTFSAEDAAILLEPDLESNPIYHLRPRHHVLVRVRTHRRARRIQRPPRVAQETPAQHGARGGGRQALGRDRRGARGAARSIRGPR
jgi:hypothetical protein